MSKRAATGQPILDVLEEAADRGVFSGAQIELGQADGVLFSAATGHTADPERFPAEPVTTHALFDVASVTKAVVTSLLTMRAVQLGLLELADTARSLVPSAQWSPSLADVSVADLLRHRSGLPAWCPFYEDLAPDQIATGAGLDAVRSAVAAREADPEQGEVYSDLGYIVLAWILEEVFGLPLDLVFIEHVAEPLGLDQSQFVPVARGAAPLQHAVATEVVDWRGGLVRGVVHDGNTWAMGGVSGHAGLFSTAGELGIVARALLAAEQRGLPWLQQDVLHQFWDPQWRGHDGHYLLGWDTPSGDVSSAGSSVARDSVVGHLGFTGCSLWIDRARQSYVVLLTNRVHPSRDDGRIKALRVQVHDLAWELLASSSQT